MGSMPPVPLTVIMTNGYTACLKTTVARHIANRLEIPIIEAYRLDSIIDDAGIAINAKRSARYAIIRELTEVYLKNRMPIVIDGSFNFYEWRKPIYELAIRYGASDVIIIACTCEDVTVAQERLLRRQADSAAPDQEITSIENYFKSKRENEPVYGDVMPSGKMPSIVEFDSIAFTARILQKNTQFVDKIQALLSEIRQNPDLSTS